MPWSTMESFMRAETNAVTGHPCPVMDARARMMIARLPASEFSPALNVLWSLTWWSPSRLQD
jgi:hypothetical protein